MAKDYYKTLGVGEKASGDEIKKAYKTLAKKYHPDLHKGDKEKEEKFKEINEAYGILGDEKSRARYDQFGTADNTGFQGGTSGFDFRDFDFDFGDFFGGRDVFGDFFGTPKGGRSRRRERGADLRYDMEISLEEAAKGAEKEISVRKFEKCERCNGIGAEKKSDFVACDTCKGSGYMRRSQRTPFGIFQTTSVCPTCEGQGKLLKNPCKDCHGLGRIEKARKISVKIPAGVNSDSKLRIAGEGEFAGEESGDLYIFIKIKQHSIFSRDGDDLNLEIPITFAQAALGAEIDVPTIDGKATLKIPSGTQTNTTFRMAGKGIPHLNSRGTGDEMVKVVVQVPKSISKKQRELLEEFEKEDKGSFFKKIF